MTYLHDNSEIIIKKHENDLQKIKDFVNKRKNKFNTEKSNGELTPRKIELYLMLAEKCLYLTGDMSNLIFEKRDKIKFNYEKHYKYSPALAKMLFLKNWAKLHKPYDKIKNKIWLWINDLQEEKNRIKLIC